MISGLACGQPKTRNQTMKVCPKCKSQKTLAVNPITGESIGIIALTILECRDYATVYWFCDDCHEMWTEITKA